ncbi:MAG: hypothetical protein HGA85_07030 [Nanoarchaeota archaeon]|nr:hypothetical protein [Nanoarchaeota archaeon]
MEIKEYTDSAAVNLAIDTIVKGKQALVFCSTRASSEATAEKIAKEQKTNDLELDNLSEQILKALAAPTKQCRRLAMCVKKGIAFHHAGLASSQRAAIEEGFKKGTIKIICSTPTLAMGVNLPAFRTIIKDLKRYGGRWGMEWIPTLEYHQMAGRAGRPDFNDTHGEAICIAGSEKDVEDIISKFITAPPENIYSKLAAEPALRTYCLSLLATGFAKSRQDLISFFSKTFYGKQYGDMEKVESILVKILGYLEDWEFIRTPEKGDFVSARDLDSGRIEVTKLGERVAQLYLDPLTANQIMVALRKATQKSHASISFIQMAASTLELRPLPTVRASEAQNIESMVPEMEKELIGPIPGFFDHDYEDFLKSVKLSLAIYDWMEEKNEEEILERFNIPPGEIHLKKELMIWILYSAAELGSLMGFNQLLPEIRKASYRIEKGVKEELIPLTRIKNIGRVRARILFRNGIKDMGDIKKADIMKLRQLIGDKLSHDLKKEVYEDVEPVPDGKRKGQLGLGKFD